MNTSSSEDDILLKIEEIQNNFFVIQNKLQYDSSILEDIQITNTNILSSNLVIDYKCKYNLMIGLIKKKINEINHQLENITNHDENNYNKNYNNNTTGENEYENNIIRNFYQSLNLYLKKKDEIHLKELINYNRIKYSIGKIIDIKITSLENNLEYITESLLKYKSYYDKLLENIDKYDKHKKKLIKEKEIIEGIKKNYDININGLNDSKSKLKDDLNNIGMEYKNKLLEYSGQPIERSNEILKEILQSCYENNQKSENKEKRSTKLTEYYNKGMEIKKYEDEIRIFEEKITKLKLNDKIDKINEIEIQLLRLNERKSILKEDITKYESTTRIILYEIKYLKNEEIRKDFINSVKWCKDNSYGLIEPGSYDDIGICYTLYNISKRINNTEDSINYERK